MPKILFRPAPTPPPFVPPTPSYDTVVHFDFDPFPYETGESVYLTFKEANLPDYFTWQIQNSHGNIIFEPGEHGKIVPNTEILCVTEVIFSTDMQLNLLLFDVNDNVVYECNAICDNH